jgi:adenylate cyclase
MEAERSIRTLRTIFAADVVAYSRHMSEAESQTIASLARHREIIDGLIAKLGGRIFTTAGDSVVAEFDSPSAAVRCACDTQKAIAAFHAVAADLRPLKFRIGIHTGDVLRRGDSLIGDAVNVAARLESFAPVGGLLISREVMDFLDPETAAPFRFRGHETLRDIARPIALYEINTVPASRTLLFKRAWRRWRISIAAAAGLIAFAYVFAAYDGIAFLKVGIGYRMAAANTVLPHDPPSGWLTPGQRMLIDDGSCAVGQIREVSGGNMTLGLSRGERCVPRP